MSSSKRFEDKGGATLSRRALVGAAGVTAATVVAGRAFAQQPPAAPPAGPADTTVHRHDAAARLRPERRRPISTSPIPTSSPSIRASMRCASPTRRSSACGPARCGRRGRRGTRRAAISCGATSPTIGSCAGSRTTAASASSAAPSNNSNGNTFDFQGRQLSCEHLTRRVVRYELDGSATVLAEAFQGKKLNSPNDVVPHPDGSYWFTDPPYGGQLYEGTPDVAGGPSNPDGKINPRLGQPPGIGTAAKRELPTNCYRIDPSGRIDLVVTEEQVPDPNGLCFSPDYKTLYVASTGKGPGDTGPGGKGEVYVLHRRHRQQGLQPQAVQRLHDRRHQVRTRRRCAATYSAMSGSRATPAARSATAASRCGTRRAS